MAASVPPPPNVPDVNNELTLTGIAPIPTKKSLMVVNSFIINTVDFLNKFDALCEEKLRNVQQSIERVSITLALLEGRLDSVGWLNGTVPPPSSAPPAAPSSAAPEAPPQQAAPVFEAPPPEPAAPLLLLKDDERYKKYFKLLGMGVPKNQLRLRMSQDGVDPDVIDMDPEGPAPEGAVMAQVYSEVNSDNDSDNDSD